MQQLVFFKFMNCIKYDLDNIAKLLNIIEKEKVQNLK